MASHRNTQRVKIKELVGPETRSPLYALIRQLNPALTRREFTQRLAKARAGGYRCFGAYRGNTLIAACGVWTMTRFWCGKLMEIDNFVVDASQRSAGVGRILLQWIEGLAEREQCHIMMAASYSHNHASHRFYFRERYVITGFVFIKEFDS